MMNENENEQSESEIQTQHHQLTIGELLKLKRAEKNLSLKIISQQTKIHISLLESLESDNLTNLPSKAYVQGFVRSTAKILNLDSKIALEALEYTYNPTEAIKASKAASVKKKKDESENRKEEIKNKELILLAQNFITKHIGLVSKLLVTILILGGLVYFVSDYVKKLPAPVVAVVEIDETTGVLPPNTSIPEVKSEAPVVAKVVTEAVAKPEVVTAPEVESKIETKIEIRPEATIDPKVLKQVKLSSVSADEEQFQDLDLTTEDYNEFLPSKFRVDVAPGAQAIFLNATKGDSWITYKADDREIKKFTLRQGRTLFIRGKVIRLFIGNSSSLNVFYNNRPVEITTRSKSGLKNIVLPEENKTQYKLPLFIFNDDGSVLTSDEYEKLMLTGPI